MGDEEWRFTTCTTVATLELGIDIGRPERAFLGWTRPSPSRPSCSAWVARADVASLPEMKSVMREDPSELRALLPETLPWKPLQGIALSSSYERERWVEPLQRGAQALQPALSPDHGYAGPPAESTESCGAGGRVLSLAPFNVSQDDHQS